MCLHGLAACHRFSFFFFKKRPWKGNDGFQRLLSADSITETEGDGCFQEWTCFYMHLLPWKGDYPASTKYKHHPLVPKLNSENYATESNWRVGGGRERMVSSLNGGCIWGAPANRDPPGDNQQMEGVSDRSVTGLFPVLSALQLQEYAI